VSSSSPLRVGLISDTHGLLRDEAVAALSGSDLIVHAGDIGKPEILERLSAIAPVTAVRGNNDHGDWASALREAETLQVHDVAVLVIHDIAQLRIDALAADVRVIVHGHSHRPAAVEKGGVLYINPGSAGPRRFSLPISVGQLIVSGRKIDYRLQTLELRHAA